jgi:hypothetical protein
MASGDVEPLKKNLQALEVEDDSSDDADAQQKFRLKGLTVDLVRDPKRQSQKSARVF